jgi:hypothetical protein
MSQEKNNVEAVKQLIGEHLPHLFSQRSNTHGTHIKRIGCPDGQAV